MKTIKKNMVGSLNMVLAVFLGGMTGLFFPQFSGHISGIHGVLSNLLQMCVIPIVVSSLIVEIVSFLKSAQRGNIRKFLGISFVFSILFAGMGAVSCFVFQPGPKTTFKAQSYLNDRVVKSAIVMRTVEEPIQRQTHQNFFDFFEQSVPRNIFKAFGANKTFQIILFTIVFSVALAGVSHGQTLHRFFGDTSEAFMRIFSFVLLFLPVLVYTSTTLSVAKVGLRVFLDMGPFLKILFWQIGIIFLLNLFVLWRLLRMPVLSLLAGLETSILVAFSGSVLAATFPALGFFKKLGTQNRQFIKVLTPISMFLNRFGNILYFSFACFFVGQIYGHTFTYEQIIFVLALSILGGIASSGSGASEGITTGLLLSILDPIEVPSGQLVLILSGLDFIVTPFLSVITLQTNVTLLSLLLKNDNKLLKQIFSWKRASL